MPSDDLHEGSMTDPEAYWEPLCKLIPGLGCWVRLAWRDGASTEVAPWGMLLIFPISSYMEASGGPVPIGQVEWVEVSTSRIKGGMAGRPLEFVDITEDLLADLNGASLSWSLCQTTWSMGTIFADEPVQVIRFPNPFGPKPDQGTDKAPEG